MNDAKSTVDPLISEYFSALARKMNGAKSKKWKRERAMAGVEARKAKKVDSNCSHAASN